MKKQKLVMRVACCFVLVAFRRWTRNIRRCRCPIPAM